MPCARMPSSLVIRKRISGLLALDELRRRTSGNASRLLVGREQAHQLLEVVLERVEGLHGEGGACGGLEIPALAMLVDLLARALDGVLLGVEQMLDEEDELDLPPLIHAVARSILGWIEKAELALPVAQHVRLEIGELADLADAEELLDGLGDHASCSARSSRFMSSCTASLAGWPSNRMRCTVATMGISTPSRAASACALLVVVTPSAMVSFPASASASVAPFPTATPTARLRLSEPVHVNTRSPIPARPAKVAGFAPSATPSRVISASPRVMSAACELKPSPTPSTMPAATAITFLSAPPSS